MATRYPRNLGLDVWEGSIGNNVEIRWTDTARERLPTDAIIQVADPDTMKALSEHYLYQLAVRRGNTKVTVRGAPHDFTINSARPDLGQQSDPCHVTGEISGGPNGKRSVHIYLGNIGRGTEKYDNVTVVGESLIKKSRNRGGGQERQERDPESWGVSGYSAPTSADYSSSTSSGYSASTSSGYSASASATTSTYIPATPSSSTVPSNAAVWDSRYNRYRRFNPNTNQWDWLYNS